MQKQNQKSETPMRDEAQEFRLVELARRLANVVRPGVVAEADYPKGLVRVKFAEEEEALTAWLPFAAARAGGDASWWAPEVGEQVLLLAPSGELAQAVVLGSLYSDAHPAPSSGPDKHLVRYSDGAEIEYDRENHVLRAVLPAGATGEITVPDRLTITGDVMVTGGVEAAGDVHSDADVTAGVNVEAGAQVEDLQGTMAEMRGTYNGHVHGAPPGIVTPPVAPTHLMT